MSMSGATITDECMQDYCEFKMPTNRRQYDYHFIHLQPPTLFIVFNFVYDTDEGKNTLAWKRNRYSK